MRDGTILSINRFMHQGSTSTPHSLTSMVLDLIVMIPSQIFRLESLATTDLLMCRCLWSYLVIDCIHTIHPSYSRYRNTSINLTFIIDA
jgi:hypothetical protein